MLWLRQPIDSRLTGYEDVNDAERLSVDPAMRHVLGGQAALTDKQAAPTSEVGRQRDGNPQLVQVAADAEDFRAQLKSPEPVFSIDPVGSKNSVDLYWQASSGLMNYQILPARPLDVRRTHTDSGIPI